jgi:hypothetical protein
MIHSTPPERAKSGSIVVSTAVSVVESLDEQADNAIALTAAKPIKDRPNLNFIDFFIFPLLSFNE